VHDTACVWYNWHCVVDVEAIRFHRCRAANPAGQYFTMDTRVEPSCSAGQVIRVQSALLGYSVSYNSGSNPSTCPWSNCTKSTYVPARLCNGRTYCRISQTILNSPGGTALCALQRDGNFIIVDFTCVTRMISQSFISVFFGTFFNLSRWILWHWVTIGGRNCSSQLFQVLIELTWSTVCMKFRYFNYFTLGQRI